MEENKDMYLLNVNEIFDSLEGKQDPDYLIDRTSKYDLCIEEYLCFLTNALHIVGSSLRMKVSQQSIDEFFIEFYLKHENSYKKLEDFAAKLIFGSILPIFANSVFIDINKAKEWERNCEIDIEKDGMPSGNGYAQEYYDKNKIIDYKYKSLLKIFSDPEIYAELRKRTLEPIELLLKSEEKRSWERIKERNSSEDNVCRDDDNTLSSFFQKNYINVINQIKAQNYELKIASELSDILDLCEEESKLFLDYLKGKKKVADYNPLTAKERIILTVYRLCEDGFEKIHESSIARAVAIEYGGGEETYRKILKQIINDGFDHDKFKNITTLMEVVKKGVSESNIEIANEKSRKIVEFTYESLLKFLGKK